MAAFISECGSGAGDENAVEKMADMFGPGQVDQMVRQAMQI